MTNVSVMAADRRIAAGCIGHAPGGLAEGATIFRSCYSGPSTPIDGPTVASRVVCTATQSVHM